MTREARASYDDLNVELMRLKLRPRGTANWIKQEQTLLRRLDESGFIERCIAGQFQYDKESTNHDEEVQELRLVLWKKWRSGELTHFAPGYLGTALKHFRISEYRRLHGLLFAPDLTDFAASAEDEATPRLLLAEFRDRLDPDETRLWDWFLDAPGGDPWYLQAAQHLRWPVGKVYRVLKRIEKKLEG